MIEPRRSVDLPSWLATLYAPLTPLLQTIKLEARRRAPHKPADILLPQGYTAELVTGDLNAPVHCCFDDAGNCYVAECGHKIDHVRASSRSIPPRVYRQRSMRSLTNGGSRRGH